MRSLYLVTGGAGFIGTNLAARLAEEGARVRILDNLSRPGSERNAAWLLERYGDRVELCQGDVRDRQLVVSALEDVEAVVHLAAQVAVTTSLQDPISDFQVNALGTLNLLEALRAREVRPPLIYTSTNKVYGALEDVGLAVNGRRYRPIDRNLRLHGLSEARPLDFCSPYGCSKGAADQYVLDYARTYHLPAAVLRMSCIYGPHQHGNEDQGWVAHFVIRALDREPITLYGDGRQVRDLLYVDDLVNAFLVALDRIDQLAGKAFNIGGGPTNTVSLLELITLIQLMEGRAPEVRAADWRTADQRYYVSDPRRFQEATGWAPQIAVPSGVRKLRDWLLEDRSRRPAAMAEPDRSAGEAGPHQRPLGSGAAVGGR